MTLTTVTLETRFTPPITFDVGLTGDAGTRGGASSVAAAILLPKVTVGPVSYAPKGDPGEQWVLFAAVAAGLVAYVVSRIVR